MVGAGDHTENRNGPGISPGAVGPVPPKVGDSGRAMQQRATTPRSPPRGGGEVLERGKGKPGSTTTHNFSPLPLKGRIQEGSMTACGGGIRESKDSHHPMPPPRGGGEC